MNNEKVLLCLTGQVSRSDENNTLEQSVDYHSKYQKFDGLLCHMWDYEFNKFKNYKRNIDFNLISSPNSFPFDENLNPYISQDELNFHAESVRITNGKDWDKDPFEAQFKRAFNSCKMISALTECFNEASKYENYSFFIRSRYDLTFNTKLNLDLISPYMKSKDPVIFVPKNITNYGLIDGWWIMNRPALLLFQNYLNDCREYSKNQRIFWAEPLFRYHLININKAKVYRFNFPYSIVYWNKVNGYELVPDMKTNSITRDLKKFKFGEHKNSWFAI